MPTSRIQSRVLNLTRLHGIAQKNVMGAYHDAPLRQLEFLLHEVAHWLVLGNAIEKIPRRLTAKLEGFFSKIPQASADSLEIDTALVTFLAGYRLGLWTDPSPIVTSCRRNLKGIMALGQDSVVRDRFCTRWVDHPRSYTDLSGKLALWFRPNAKLLPTSSITPGSFGV